MLLTGSIAAKHWFPDFPRTPDDIDVIFPGRKGKNEHVEYHGVDAFRYILDNNRSREYVDPDFLYTIKVSHAAWDVRWDKTMNDIVFLKNKGCRLDKYLYKTLLKEWEVIHGKKKVVLKGTAEEFFNKNVTRAMPHDNVHEMVKFYDKPLYSRINKESGNVACSEELWESLSYDDKLKCSLEEIYVFALERYNNYPPKFAFYKALKHLITLSTKGRFNLFLVENFNELMQYDKSRYFNTIETYKEMLNGKTGCD